MTGRRCPLRQALACWWPVCACRSPAAASWARRNASYSSVPCTSLPRVKHEHTHHVAAPADKVYAALADVSNLPRYVPQLTSATPHDGDHVTVQARYEGHTQQGE